MLIFHGVLALTQLYPILFQHCFQNMDEIGVVFITPVIKFQGLVLCLSQLLYI